MHAKLLLFTLFMTVASMDVFSQSTYQGSVIDKKGKSIGFAHVFFHNNQSKGTITNELGEFAINVTEAKTMRLFGMGIVQEIRFLLRKCWTLFLIIRNLSLLSNGGAF